MSIVVLTKVISDDVVAKLEYDKSSKEGCIDVTVSVSSVHNRKACHHQAAQTVSKETARLHYTKSIERGYVKAVEVE